MSEETLSCYVPLREILSNSIAMGLSEAGEQEPHMADTSCLVAGSRTAVAQAMRGCRSDAVPGTRDREEDLSDWPWH